MIAQASWHLLAIFTATVARFAEEATSIDLSHAKWLFGASVPAALSLVFVPWLLFLLSPPEITHTSDAMRLASEELARVYR